MPFSYRAALLAALFIAPALTYGCDDDDADTAPAATSDAGTSDAGTSDAGADTTTDAHVHDMHDMGGMDDMDSGMTHDGMVHEEGTVSDSGDYTLHLVDADWAPTVGEHSLRVHFMGADGHVMASDLAMEPWMPHHGHGSPSVPSFSDEGEGTWLVEGVVFTMPGFWELRVTGTINGTAERFVVPVDVQ